MTLLGSNVLWLAAYSGSTALVRSLLDSGADSSLMTNSAAGEHANMTATDIARAQGHEEVVALLREHTEGGAS